MSNDAGDPRPPRRAKPPPEIPKSPPKPQPAEIREGMDTWKPAEAPSSPQRPGAKTAKSSARRSPGDREPRLVAGGPNAFERVLLGNVSTDHLATFSRQFAAYLHAGIDLIRSLDNLTKQFSRTALGPVIGRVAASIRRGDSLTNAFAREPQAFDGLFLSMIEVAEARGGVPETLRRMGDHYDAKQRLIRQARSALIYPAILTLVAIIAGGLLTIFVMPKLVDILEDMTRGKGELPWPPRVLMALSHFIQTIGWFVLPAAFFGSLFALAWAYRRPRGKAVLDELSLYIPVLGSLLLKIDTARFSRTLSALLGSGVDFAASLNLTARVLYLVPLRRAVSGASDLIVDGTELSEALEISKRFPHELIAIVQTGEETGRLPETLDKLADDYEEQVENMVKNLGNLLQPVILLVLGVVVGFIVIAFIMAYVSVISNLAGGGGL
jgi:type IV pilus assembly protein PilC